MDPELPSAVLRLRAIEARSNLSLATHVVSAGVEAYWGFETRNYTDHFFYFYPAQHGLNLLLSRFDLELARACELSGATVLRSATLMRALKRKRVGDAAMAFDPVASQGIAKAFAHGKRAAANIASHLAGEAAFLERLPPSLEREYMAYRAYEG